MLNHTYTVKTSKETDLKTFPITELYVAPDLSFISGVTDYNIGITNGENVAIKSPYLFGKEVTTINTVNVLRQGKLCVKIRVPVNTIIKSMPFMIYSNNGNYIIVNGDRINISDDIEGDYISSSVTQNYIEYKGDVSYLFKNKGYLINHKFYSANESDEYVDVIEYLYIEDGKISVGGKTYYVDFSKEVPEIKANKYEEKISGNTFLGYIENYPCSAMPDNGNAMVVDFEPSKWHRVTKFSIVGKGNVEIKPNEVLYGGYRGFANVNGTNYYLKDCYASDGSYLGYGTMIDDEFFSLYNGYTSEELLSFHKDINYDDGMVVNEDFSIIYPVENSLVAKSNDGNVLILVDSNDNNDVVVNNIIVANSNSDIFLKRDVLYDELADNAPYITYQGKKYYIESNLYDTISIGDSEYKLDYLNNEMTSAKTTIDGSVVYFDITNGKAYFSDNVYYGNNSESNILVKYGKDENGYVITETSGVTIGSNIFPVSVDTTLLWPDPDGVSSDGDNIGYNVSVHIEKNVSFELLVNDINGSATYVCSPIIDDEIVDEVEIDGLQREIVSIIVDNWGSFDFELKRSVFGSEPLDVESHLANALLAAKPYTATDNYLLEKNIEIFRINNYISFNFPLVVNTANNLKHDDIVSSDFTNYVKELVINNVVDMEKDIYYPSWKGEDENGELIFNLSQQVRFNLHFRNRNLDNWKVYDDKGYFVTDYSYYTDSTNNFGKALHNSSDLLGFLNFTTNEIKNRAKKISKSFLRLSFFSTDDPATQILLATSVIYLDENNALGKYMSLKRNSDLDFINVLNNTTAETVSNLTEVSGDTVLNDSLRLSSRIVVDNKTATKDSSEGYYLYLFKEYSTKMREGIVYMKVEFNHAGIGTSIPFMLPRKNDGTPLYLPTDMKKLKEGFAMKDIYNQTFIPINVKYDDKLNKYIYYLPDNIVENKHLEVDDNIMEFNLFEVKFADESLKLPT